MECSLNDLRLGDTVDDPIPELGGSDAADDKGSVVSGGTRCLQAVQIALGQASNGIWFVSTLELQLVSFGFCHECRSIRTLSVRVERNMPLSLRSDDDGSDLPLEDKEPRRLPRLQAASACWNMPTEMCVPLLLSESDLLSGVQSMELVIFNRGYWYPSSATRRTHGTLLWPQPATVNMISPSSYFEAMRYIIDLVISENTYSLSWPTRLTKVGLSYDGCFGHASKGDRGASRERLEEVVGNISWPTSLQKLTLDWIVSDDSHEWTSPVTFPRSDHRRLFCKLMESIIRPGMLVELKFGKLFNERLNDVVWPASLLTLTFGRDFDKPIGSMVWPSSLLQLTFGDKFNQPIDDALFPASLLDLAFGRQINSPIGSVSWPTALQCLVFGERCNQPVASVTWPTSLRVLKFKYSFNQPVVAVKWPISLQHLTFGHRFDHPIDGIDWPASLLQLKLGHPFKHLTSCGALPASLDILDIGDQFNQSIDADELLPVGLEEFILGSCFNHSIDGVKWAAPLLVLSLGDRFNLPLERVHWPQLLRQLSFGFAFNQPVVDVVWPRQLQSLEFVGRFNQPIVGVTWPLSLTLLSFGYYFNQQIVGAVWPKTLKELEFGMSFAYPLSGIFWPTALEIRVSTSKCLYLKKKKREVQN